MDRKVFAGQGAAILIVLLLIAVIVFACGCSGGTSGDGQGAAEEQEESYDAEDEPDDAETGASGEKPVFDPKKVEAGKYPIIDSHLHYLDFLQETDGFKPLVKAMNDTNVPYAILFGMAMAKQWDENAPNKPDYYLSNDSRCYYYSATDYIMMEDYMAQPESVRKRFFPFICGINPNDKYAARQLKRLLKTYPDDIYGIGEVMSRHDDLTALTYGEPPRADHPAYLKVYDLAAKYDIPVLIHHNIAPSYEPKPLYRGEMEKALAHNRKTKIIWAHTGISRRVEVKKHVRTCRKLLKKHPNLYYDISWVVCDDYINRNKNSLKAWAKLLDEFPDRFMIGSDKVGHWEGYENEVYKYYPLLDRLKESTVEKVTKTNILGLIHVDPKSLSKLKEGKVSEEPKKVTVKKKNSSEEEKKADNSEEENKAA